LQALAQSHFLKERGCFPPRVKDPTDIAHFFFQACAIEMTAPQLAVVAATLAGIGKCPTTNKECFSTDVSRTLLSLLYSCGMTSVSGRATQSILVCG
jgi:glutaminase